MLYFSDKVAHLLVYFVLCGLTYRAIVYQNRFPMLKEWSVLSCLLITIAYGASDEFHQSFVPSRDASVYDLAADALGALLFLLFILLRRQSK